MVVFHEQVLQMVSVMAGVSLAEADEVRRALGDKDKIEDLRTWFLPAALGRGYPLSAVEDVWEVLRAFGSFGFCKAHAAAFALPTYQSAWLKAHHPAAFLAGVLTHDPGMYPKRLILDDARQFGIAVLSLDVNASDGGLPGGAARGARRASAADPRRPARGRPPPRSARRRRPRHGEPVAEPGAARRPGAYGIRLALAEVKGITEAEVTRIVAGRPYATLADFWHRAGVSRPVVERLVLAGAFDSLYGIGAPAPVRRRGGVTRRDLLLQVLRARHLVARDPAGQRRTAGPRRRRRRRGGAPRPRGGRRRQPGPAALPGRRCRSPRWPTPPCSSALDLGDDPSDVRPTGLPEMNRRRAGPRRARRAGSRRERARPLRLRAVPADALGVDPGPGRPHAGAAAASCWWPG